MQNPLSTDAWIGRFRRRLIEAGGLTPDEAEHYIDTTDYDGLWAIWGDDPEAAAVAEIIGWRMAHEVVAR